MSGKNEVVSLCRGNTSQCAYFGGKRGSEAMSGKHEAVNLCQGNTRQ